MPVVAAIDERKRADPILTEAAQLADLLDTEIHAVHVVERSRVVEVLEDTGASQNITENPEIQEIAAELVAEANGDIDAPVTPVVRVGDPAEEVIGEADDIDVEYIVIGGRQRSPTGKALFGSVTQQVLFQADIPVVNVSLD